MADSGPTGVTLNGSMTEREGEREKGRGGGGRDVGKDNERDSEREDVFPTVARRHAYV